MSFIHTASSKYYRHIPHPDSIGITVNGSDGAGGGNDGAAEAYAYVIVHLSARGAMEAKA